MSLTLSLPTISPRNTAVKPHFKVRFLSPDLKSRLRIRPFSEGHPRSK